MRATKSAGARVALLPAPVHRCEPVRVASAALYVCSCRSNLYILFDGMEAKWSFRRGASGFRSDSICYPLSVI
jgi:hypothetical protein